MQAQLIVQILQDALLYKEDIGPTPLDLLAYVLPLNPSVCAFLSSVTILMGFRGRIRVRAEAVRVQPGRGHRQFPL